MYAVKQIMKKILIDAVVESRHFKKHVVSVYINSTTYLQPGMHTLPYIPSIQLYKSTYLVIVVMTALMR